MVKQSTGSLQIQLQLSCVAVAQFRPVPVGVGCRSFAESNFPLVSTFPARLFRTTIIETLGLFIHFRACRQLRDGRHSCEQTSSHTYLT